MQTYQIGIDEAGYGPNLGPLVMTVVVAGGPGGDLWELLREAVRRGADEDDGRLMVADSKVVYFPSEGGLRALERSVAPLVRTAHRPRDRFPSLGCLLEGIGGGCLAELRDECWFHGKTTLPVEMDEDEVCVATDRLRHAAAAAGVRLVLVGSAIVCPPRFNALCERWDSKAAVLGLSLAELLTRCLELPGNEPFEIIVDKHGGRNTYGALVQHAFPDALVLPREEGAVRSVYELQCLPRQMRITFMPRAEEASFCVALASMVSKYLREVLMHEFNEFWRIHVPGLRPTAGYPGDSDRFFNDISAAVTRLGIAKEKIWRTR